MTRSQNGHLIVVLMVFVAIMTIALLAAAQSWSFLVRRDKEAELIFRGKEYSDAILFYFTENNAYPLDLNVLVNEGGPHRHRYIRRLYKDPLAEDGLWGLLYLSPAGKGFINPWASPGADGQLFTPEQYGFDPSQDRSGVRGGNTRESTGLPAGTTELVQKQMEQLRGKTTGLPIVGVVHKKNETGIKLYNNIASINDWAFVPESVMEGLGVAAPRGRRPVVGGGGGPGGLGDSQHPIYLDPTKRPGYDPNKFKKRGVKDELKEAKEEYDRTHPSDEEEQYEDEQPPEEDPNAEADDESDPNAEEEEKDPNAEEEDPNAESGDDGFR